MCFFPLRRHCARVDYLRVQQYQTVSAFDDSGNYPYIATGALNTRADYTRRARRRYRRRRRRRYRPRITRPSDIPGFNYSQLQRNASTVTNTLRSPCGYARVTPEDQA